MRGVWVHEIGTSPYFTNVAPGEVTDLPNEASEEEPSGGYHGQQVEYPPYEAEGGQIQINPVQYQPVNPEVVIIDDTDINVDGNKVFFFFTYITQLNIINTLFMFSVFSYNLGTCSNNRHKCSQFGDCRDYAAGYCCHCRPGFYGNGIQCVAEGTVTLYLNTKVTLKGNCYRKHFYYATK